jgi:hypothetical protein
VDELQDKWPNGPVSGKSIAKLLRELGSADAGAAWMDFLDRYSALIMNSACQFVCQQERVNECFGYVCEHPSDDGFRRLLKFSVNGKAKFRTWLGSVVLRLCVDWHRKEFGRAALLPAITALPAFDQSVFHLVIERGMGAGILSTAFPSPASARAGCRLHGSERKYRVWPGAGQGQPGTGTGSLAIVVPVTDEGGPPIWRPIFLC